MDVALRCLVSTARLRWGGDGDRCCWKGCPSPTKTSHVITGCFWIMEALQMQLKKCNSTKPVTVLQTNSHNSVASQMVSAISGHHLYLCFSGMHVFISSDALRSASSPSQADDESSLAIGVILGMLWSCQNCCEDTLFNCICWTQQFGRGGCYNQWEKGIELKGDWPPNHADNM